jgi:peptide/nickel transport system permease protein
VSKYILRRVALAIPTILGLTIIVFLMVRLLPGDVVDAMAGGESTLDPARKQAMLERLGLLEPLHVQYFTWLGQIFSGELGYSLRSPLPLRRDFLNALPITLELGFLAALIACIVGIPLGVLAAVKRNSPIDNGARLLGTIGLAVPSFYLATLALLFTSTVMHWVPGLFWISPLEDPIGNLKQMFLPALCLSFGLMAITVRMTRATMQEVLTQDYVRTSHAKGLKPNTVVVRHALRNALIPVITIIGVQLGYLLSGSVIIEQIFGLPGIGWFFLQGLLNRDYPAIQLMALFLVLLFVILNLVTDVIYAYVDPRIRFHGAD